MLATRELPRRDGPLLTWFVRLQARGDERIMKKYVLEHRLFGGHPLFTRPGSIWQHDRYYAEDDDEEEEEPLPPRRGNYDRPRETRPARQPLYVTPYPKLMEGPWLTSLTISNEYGARIRVENLHYNITEDELYVSGEQLVVTERHGD